MSEREEPPSSSVRPSYAERALSLCLSVAWKEEIVTSPSSAKNDPRGEVAPAAVAGRPSAAPQETLARSATLSSKFDSAIAASSFKRDATVM